MPQAKPPTPPKTPAPLSDDETKIIKAAVARAFGVSAVVRNYGPDPAELRLHVEADSIDRQLVNDLMGLLYARIDRDRIGVGFTKRGSRIAGNEKIAYRQGVVL